MTLVDLTRLMAYPVHPGSWERPKGNIDYRVTNPFDGEDLVNGGRHNANDLGNFRTGDPIRAPIDCMAHAWTHFDGAKIVEMALGGVVTLLCAHLSRIDLTQDWTPVQSGQVLGLTGNSGVQLGGKPMPAHTHVELRRDGFLFDPEPYLLGQPLDTEEADMKTPAGGRALVVGDVGPGNRLRVDPMTKEGSQVLGQTIGDPGQPREVQVLLSGVKGEPYTLDGKTGDEYLWIGTLGQTWYVAAPLVTGLRLKGMGETVAGGFTSEDMAASKLAGRGEMQREAIVAVQRLTP